MGDSVCVRFAPSPTGALHVGGVRTALFNWLFARHHGGRLVLRIEDTDLERSRPEHTEQILDSLRWLGLFWDGAPVFQSRRGDLYRQVLERMLADGTAFRCFVAQEQVRESVEEAKRGDGRAAFFSPDRDLDPAEARRRAEAGERHVIRFRCPPGETVYTDAIRGEIRVDHAQVGDIVLARADGSPTYNFCNVVDDLDLGITHVIRGEDHISNTPKQILLFRALGHEPPAYGHLPLIHGPDKRKLSKRHGAVTTDEYRAMGFLPDALINYLALLGWSPGTDQEIFSRAELVAQFSLERINRAAAVFDHEKLRWMNGVYLRALPEDAYLAWGREAPAVKSHAAQLDPASLRRLLLLFRERARTWEELAYHLEPFFAASPTFDPTAEAKHLGTPHAKDLLLAAADLLEALPAFADPKGIEEQLRGLAEERGVKFGQLVHPCRVALTGRDHGAGLTDTMVLLGQARTVARLRSAAARAPVQIPH